MNDTIAELKAERDELRDENTDLRTSLDAKGFIARWQEAENMGYQCGRSHAERDLFIAEKTAEAEKKRADEAEAALAGARNRGDNWKEACYATAAERDDYKAKLAAAEAQVKELKATITKVIPFIGWEASVPDLLEEAMNAVQYGEDKEAQP